jgi:methionyl-tRNA formyltransferase
VRPRAQDEGLATLAPKLRKEDGLIDWKRGAREIVNLVRGVNPWPGAYTHLDGRPLKVWKAGLPRPAAFRASRLPTAEPGTVVAASADAGLLVACGGAETVALLTLQAEGKRPLQAPEFLRGRALEPGTLLA